MLLCSVDGFTLLCGRKMIAQCGDIPNATHQVRLTADYSRDIFGGWSFALHADVPPVGINLNAAFHAMRAVIPGMKARGWGRIISTASAHSLTASAFKSAYVAAKHGLTGLSKAVALEVATHGITVNCISPAYVWTPLVEAQIPDTMAARNMTREQVINEVMLERQPTKQFVTPEQVAASAVFLCSDAACQMTGSNLVIDGGWTAQ